MSLSKYRERILISSIFINYKKHYYSLFILKFAYHRHPYWKYHEMIKTWIVIQYRIYVFFKRNTIIGIFLDKILTFI